MGGGGGVGGGMERTPKKSSNQHTKLTQEKKIPPPLQPEIETTTFRSRTRRLTKNQQKKRGNISALLNRLSRLPFSDRIKENSCHTSHVHHLFTLSAHCSVVTKLTRNFTFDPLSSPRDVSATRCILLVQLRAKVLR